MWLSLVLDSNPPEWFRLNQIKVPGLSWGLCKQYALKLHRIGILDRNRYLWRITPAGMKYYQMFHAEFARKLSEPVKWL